MIKINKLRLRNLDNYYAKCLTGMSNSKDNWYVVLKIKDKSKVLRQGELSRMLKRKQKDVPVQQNYI